MLNLNLVYTSTNGTFHNAWRPTITKFTQSLDNGGNYQIFGTQFNGLSQANSFGDEFQVPATIRWCASPKRDRRREIRAHL